MTRKPFPDLDEALLLAGKYLIGILIPGKHWLPKTIRQTVELIFIIMFWIVAIFLAYVRIFR